MHNLMYLILQEVDLDCPMSSSIPLLERIDDKLWTRLLLAKHGSYYPETLAFCYQPFLEYDSGIKDISIIWLDTRIGVENRVYTRVQNFLSSLDDKSKVIMFVTM